jgi:hypothetical protein
MNIDPPNAKDLIKAYPKGDPSTVLRYTNQILPGWIKGYSIQFSKDLGKYNEQWARGCAQLDVEPQSVILVESTHLETQKTTHTLVRKAIEMLTTHGYVVMDLVNFAVCSQCEQVIVSKEKMEKGKLSFSGKCQSCCPYNPHKPYPEDKPKSEDSKE